MKKCKIHVSRTPREFGKMLGLSIDEILDGELQVNLLISIRKTIKKKKWTKIQAAKKIGVSQAVINAIIVGDVTKLPTKKLLNIADKLGLEIKLKVA